MATPDTAALAGGNGGVRPAAAERPCAGAASSGTKRLDADRLRARLRRFYRAARRRRSIHAATLSTEPFAVDASPRVRRTHAFASPSRRAR